VIHYTLQHYSYWKILFFGSNVNIFDKISKAFSLAMGNKERIGGARKKWNSTKSGRVP
jgi:hypothetical protein